MKEDGWEELAEDEEQRRGARSERVPPALYGSKAEGTVTPMVRCEESNGGRARRVEDGGPQTRSAYARRKVQDSGYESLQSTVALTSTVALKWGSFLRELQKAQGR